MQIFATLIFLSLISVVENGIFSSSLAKLKNKAKDMYRKKGQKGKVLNFWGYDESEYPRNNKNKLQENKAKWNEYYDCLNKQNDNLGPQKTLTPEAILAMDGSSIRMDCKLCLNPLEIKDKESVEWKRAPPDSQVLEPIDYDENVLVSPEDKTLIFYNLKPENSGQYVCGLKKSATVPYFLTVVPSSPSSFIEVFNERFPAGPHPKQPELLSDFNLILDTQWEEWSACSTCNVIGKRHKFGYCSIFSKKIQEDETSNIDESKSEESLFGIFKIFKYGIPCQSYILPDIFKQTKEVLARKNEIMTGFCQVKCDQTQLFKLEDKHGKTIETANNSAGIYSLSQKLPLMEPQTERRVKYVTKGKNTVLQCPGNIGDTPLQWQIGEKNILPEIISKQSEGRIFISITDKLHINRAKISDSNIYSCWQQNELVGTIRLVVEKKLQINFNHTIMLLGIVLILGTFLYVFLKMMVAKKHLPN